MRKIWDFHGGIHPPEHKTDSLGLPLATPPLPEELILPLQQHIGAPAEPLVEPGTEVLKGQKIAEAKGPVSAPIHAPTSGMVVGVEDRPLAHPSGMTGPCLVLRPDGEERWIERHPLSDWRQRDNDSLLTAIREAGIAGLGGAGFPAAVKLRASHPIDTLILNGTECEPYITADDWLMQHRAAEIVAGTAILSHLLGEPETVLIGIEDNKPEAIAAMREACADTRFEVVVFPTKYPSGGEKQLIEILTGKEVPTGSIPAQIGIVVQNVGTAAAVHRAIEHGEPLISRITTLTGEALAERRNLEVLLGTPFSHLLNVCGVDWQGLFRLVMGGPMMGFTVDEPAVPVIKTTNCIIAAPREEFPPPPPAQPCIRCGMCAEACPASLLPQQLFWYAQAKDNDKLQAYNLFDCIECGACSYVCPSHIPLVQYYRAAKGEIRHLAQEKIKSDRARERFEARKARIEREEAEKAARREARRKAAQEAAQRKQAEGAADSGGQPDLVKQALARVKTQPKDPAEEKARLERAVQAAEDKVKKLEQQVAEAEDDEQKAKLEARLRNAEQRLRDNRDKLDTLERDDQGAEAKAEQDSTTASTGGETASADPVQAAIERAQAKMAMSPQRKLETTIESLEKRLSKAKDKAAEAAGTDNEAALQAGVDKLEQKLADAKEELAQLAEADAEQQSVPSQENQDAAGSAIRRAQEKAAAMAAMSEQEKLQAQVESLRNRLDKARDRLAKAEAEDDDNVDAFRTSVEKLDAKLRDAESQLQETQ